MEFLLKKSTVPDIQYSGSANGFCKIILTPQELEEVQEEIEQMRRDGTAMLKIKEERDTLRKNFSEVSAMLRKENRILEKMILQQRSIESLRR